MKHAQQCVIDVSDVTAGIERQNSGGNAFQDRFHLPAPLFEFCVHRAQIAAGSLDLATGVLQIVRHAVERLHQFPNFVGSPKIDAIIEAAAQEGQPATASEVLAEVRRLGLQTPSEAVAIIRNDRDGR